ncbi:MAG: D-TA family PLP-dependent enzyme [Pirellulaceae bacterium]
MIELADYVINDTNELLSPSLCLFLPLLKKNLDETIRLCGGPDRWRPHVKTHKTREIVRIQLERGVTKHKCATIAEAEMLADVGALDVFVAYPMVGPNIQRLVKLTDQFPQTRFATTVDSEALAVQLGEAFDAAGRTIEVLLDLNPGMSRTGVYLNREAIELYELICSTPGLAPRGLHWYDGQHRQPELAERKAAVLAGWEQFVRFRDQLLISGFEVPTVVASGSGSFAILAQTEEPGLELSPGTTTLFDADCDSCFSELDLRPAVAIFTRVVSRPDFNRLTFDVGHKSCAADQPAGRRLYFPAIPDAREIQHTEEHLVVETDRAGNFEIGQGTIAISRHICPTMALHDYVNVVDGGEIVDRWQIAARNRMLSI